MMARVPRTAKSEERDASRLATITSTSVNAETKNWQRKKAGRTMTYEITIAPVKTSGYTQNRGEANETCN
jgi:hypothetical protein